jgi:hypothetical protein
MLRLSALRARPRIVPGAGTGVRSRRAAQAVLGAKLHQMLVRFLWNDVG